MQQQNTRWPKSCRCVGNTWKIREKTESPETWFKPSKPPWHSSESVVRFTVFLKTSIFSKRIKKCLFLKDLRESVSNSLYWKVIEIISHIFQECPDLRVFWEKKIKKEIIPLFPPPSTSRPTTGLMLWTGWKTLFRHCNSGGTFNWKDDLLFCLYCT